MFRNSASKQESSTYKRKYLQCLEKCCQIDSFFFNLGTNLKYTYTEFDKDYNFQSWFTVTKQPSKGKKSNSFFAIGCL